MTEQQEKRYALNFVLYSLGYILFGLLLLFLPNESKRFICFLVGGAAVAFGIIKIVWHFAKDDVSRAFHNDIPAGVILVVAGIYLIANPETLWNWLPIILGFAIVFDSVVKLQHAFDLKRTGFGPWWGVLIASLATGVLGILLIMGVIGQTILVMFFGIVLTLDGVVNLITITLLWFSLKKHRKKLAKPAPAPEPQPAQIQSPPAPEDEPETPPTPEL